MESPWKLELHLLIKAMCIQVRSSRIPDEGHPAKRDTGSLGPRLMKAALWPYFTSLLEPLN